VSNRYLLAVISNQGGISLKPDPKTVKSDQKRLADFKGKVSAVVSQLDLPVTVYAATGRDEYRKPRVGMWRELLDDHDLDIMETVDLESSFFVGDAGGREAVAGITGKDHSCVDRYAALSKACSKGVHRAKDSLGISLPTSAFYSTHQRNTSWNSRFSHS
jgi:DNA 3'-phosphatase